ncbi:MAG: hypothetical protein IRZ09_07670 [Variibacter sp.]|nr:hypothetical protein [Variibacter sp.]
MSAQRYWVIGGEFKSLEFAELVGGTEQVYGPFCTRGDAESTWRAVSERHRPQCNVRFTIVEEGTAAR